jgi:outer membrane protein assembly factor BamB
VCGGGDWLAIAAGGGTVACVPLASGDVLWRTTVEGLDWNPRMREELLLAVGRDAAFCFDARTGRTLTSFRVFSSGRQRGIATLTPEGLAVSMEVFGDYVSLTVAPADAGGAAHAYVADVRGGRLLDAAGALPSGLRVTTAARAPVVANGRAVLEC